MRSPDFTTANILLKLANIDEWTEEQIYERLGRPEPRDLNNSPGEKPNPSSPRYTVHAISMKEVDPQWLSQEIIIIDFGIAFLQAKSSPYIGTPKSYCAPEFLFHLPRSVSSDIWALGCTIFEIRTGTRLFSYPGKPTRSQTLMAMVTMLGTLPEQWWKRWDDGREWYEKAIASDGELAESTQGNLYSKLVGVGK